MNQEKIIAPIDIREDYLLKKDHLLEILLLDKTTSKSVLVCFWLIYCTIHYSGPFKS